MTVVAVDAGPWAAGRRSWKLSPGDQLGFGSDDQVVDLALPDQRLAGVVGRVEVADDGWSIENSTAETPILAENVSGHDFLSVPPSVEVCVPFASARVLVFGHDTLFDFSVVAEPYPSRSSRCEPVDGCGQTLLNPGSKYFGVLVALCEPALRYGSLTTIPTSAEMAERLRRLPAFRSITSATIDFHLNYLCTQKLRTFMDAYSSITGAPPSITARNRRSTLVQLAVRFNLITRRHLDLLDGDAQESCLLTLP